MAICCRYSKTLSNAAFSKTLIERVVMLGFLEQATDLELLVAEDAGACLELLTQVQPNLLLIDINLPDLNGKQLLGQTATA